MQQDLTYDSITTLDSILFLLVTVILSNPFILFGLIFLTFILALMLVYKIFFSVIRLIFGVK